MRPPRVCSTTGLLEGACVSNRSACRRTAITVPLEQVMPSRSLAMSTRWRTAKWTLTRPVVFKTAASTLCGILDFPPRRTGHSAIPSLCPVTKYELTGVACIGTEVLLRPLQDSSVRGRLSPAKPPVVHQPSNVRVHGERFQFVQRHECNAIGNLRANPVVLHQTRLRVLVRHLLEISEINSRISDAAGGQNYARSSEPQLQLAQPGISRSGQPPRRRKS